MEYDEVRFNETLKDELDISMDKAAKIIQGWLSDFTPKRTWKTATSWIVIPFDRDDYYITNTNEPIITFLTEDTKEHFIGAQHGHPLHWEDDDHNQFFAWWVIHPGTTGQDIVGQALNAAEPELEMLWDMAIDAANRETLS
jgi:hypothetical protein